jgi:beta-1,4-mannosyltransferase
MNETSPTAPGQIRVLVPHGHYRSWYDEPEPGAIVPGRILAFGLIRAYKGMDDLVRAFRGMDGSQTLVIAGRPDSPQTMEALTEAKGNDQRITLDLRFVPDDVLADHVAQAQVVVLPYPQVHNSGVALLALSMNRPVLMRRSAATALLVEEFGAAWVHLFDGELTPAVLSEALLATAAGGGRVEMESRDWAVLARRTVEAYETAVKQARKRR